MMADQSGPKSGERTVVEYERLNRLGRAVFVAGAVAGMSAKLARRAAFRVRDVARETKRAFRAGVSDQEEERGESL